MKLSRTLVLIPGTISAAEVACGSSDLGSNPRAADPRVTAIAVRANPHNVLSALVTFRAEQAESARVVFVGESLPPDSTPYVRVTPGTDTIAVLGLRPSTHYRQVLQLVGAGGSTASDTVFLSTSALPQLLEHLSISTTGTGGPGLTLTSAQVGGHTVVAFAFDAAGAIRWYRLFDGKEPVSGDLKQQPNGHFTLYRGTSFGSQQVPGEYIEFTAAGDSLRSITVARPSFLDNHELLLTTGPDGAERRHFFEYDHRPLDLGFVGVPS